jgi:hypothetical protein
MPKPAAVDSLGVVAVRKGCTSALVNHSNIDGKHAGDRFAEV